MNCEGRKVTKYEQATGWYAVWDDQGSPIFERVAFWATFEEDGELYVDGMAFCGETYATWCQEDSNFIGYHSGNMVPEEDSDNWNDWRRKCKKT